MAYDCIKPKARNVDVGDVIVNVALHALGIQPSGTLIGERQMVEWANVVGCGRKYSPTTTEFNGIVDKSRAKTRNIIQAPDSTIEMHLGRGSWWADAVISGHGVSLKGGKTAPTEDGSVDLALGASANFVHSVAQSGAPLFLISLWVHNQELIGKLPVVNNRIEFPFTGKDIRAHVVEISKDVLAAFSGEHQGSFINPISRAFCDRRLGFREDVRRVKNAAGDEVEYKYNRMWARPGRFIGLYGALADLPDMIREKEKDFYK